MPRPPTAELSSRHLPDLSDTSFQIPLAANYGDFLLANNDDDDFLRGYDDSIVTLAPERIEHEPLTLSQLTPKPKPRAEATTAGRSSPLKAPKIIDTDTQVTTNETHTTTVQSQITKYQPMARSLGKARPNPTITAGGIALMGEGPSGHHQEEPFANCLNLPTHMTRLPLPNTEHRVNRAPRAAQPTNIRKQGKRTVTEGGISKPLDKLPKSCLTRAITAASRKSEPGRLVDEIVLNAQLSPKEDHPGHSAENSNSSAADAKKLMTSFGLSDSEQKITDVHCQQIPKATRDCPAVNTLSAEFRDTGSVTLAELSSSGPHKLMSIDQAQYPKVSRSSPSRSSMRLSRKRASPDSTSSPKQPCKKGKMNNTAFDATALRLSARDNVDVIGSSSSSTSCSSGVGRGKTKHEARPGAARTGRGSRRIPRTDQGNDNGSSQSSLSKDRIGSENSQGSPGAVESRRMPYSEVPNLTRTNPTKPVGFIFRPDTRIEEHKVELLRKVMEMSTAGRNRRHNRHQVPDFKALHAMQQEELLASRKEKNPVLPIPFQLSTDDRARERQKFDEMIKEKQKEIERAMEEKRREREAQEEKEIKEIRKKAVPKAHEVPEWYSQAPKRVEREPARIQDMRH